MYQKAIFVYISDELSDNRFVRDYYEKAWADTPGYRGSLPRHYMEIPTWITLLSGRLLTPLQTLFVVDNMTYAKKAVASTKSSLLFGSVMDVNKHLYKQLVQASPQCTWYLGGYIDPKYFSEPNVVWLDNIEDLEKYLDFYDSTAGPEYGLFIDKHIPRLSLSEGCTYACSFCTIPRKITEYSTKNIVKQVHSFEDTDFQLVYINDKTFGQASNWEITGVIYQYLKWSNPDFQGFIVQTTAGMALKNIEEWYTLYGVDVVEVGVEMPDDTFLKRMRKPYRMHILDDLCNKIRNMHRKGLMVRFVPNLIFGWPDATEEDYQTMIGWVYKNRDIITFVNPYVLCDYHNSKGTKGDSNLDIDTDENSLTRTWLSTEESAMAYRAMQKVFAITLGEYDEK